ncbi:hypothetical protein BDZ91DRAFT_731821 [Kalaharituber pfeilii]|nr:hypothetical protein BDZ91DRAFT_731821 [Kalaharituber pfeilii]
MKSADDTYIMVEDELCDVAHLYTRSLHRAEYQRLQELASTKHASAISEIQRSSNAIPLMSSEALARHERIVARAKELEKKRSLAPKVKDEALSSDEEEKEIMSQWQGTNLGAMMLSPGRREKDLSSKWKVRAATRAAAGFGRNKSGLESQSQSQRFSQQNARNADAYSSRRHHNSLKTKDPSEAKLGNSIKYSAVFNGNRKTVKLENTANYSDDDDDDDDDDDLDAGVIKSKLPTFTPPGAGHSRVERGSAQSSLVIAKLKDVSPSTSRAKVFTPSESHSKGPNATSPSSISVDLSLFDDFLPKATPTKSLLANGGYRGKAMAALEKKRRMEGT